MLETKRMDSLLDWLAKANERSELIATKADMLREKMFAEVDKSEESNGVSVGYFTKFSEHIGNIECNLKRIESLIDSF
jgi:hypothetical protein